MQRPNKSKPTIEASDKAPRTLAKKGNHGRHTVYRDGKPRPLFRGWLHGMVSAALLVSWLATLHGSLPVVLGLRRIEQLGFLGGKFLSYAASAYYHLVDFSDPGWVRWANIIDVAAVPFAEFGIIAGCASASVFRPLIEPLAPELFSTGLSCEVAIFVVVFVLNGFGVYQQFKTKVPGRADLRSAVVVVYYVCSELAAYSLATGFNTPFLEPLKHPTTATWPELFWYATPVFYVSAFACGAVVDEFRMKECVCFPHHAWFRGKWTLHEDFHFLLLLADAFAAASMITSYQAMTASS